MRTALTWAAIAGAVLAWGPLAMAAGDDTPAAAAKGAAADSPPSADAKFKEAEAAEVEKGWARAPVAEAAVVTHHQLAFNGRTLHYTATAGTLTLRDDRGKPTASIFYVAYTLDGAGPPTSRPVTFFYNGGPGSSTVWLHMGSFGPMRVRTSNAETIRPAPFAFGPNPDTLLDKSDLVFIDAPGAGYSRALEGTEDKTFWGVDPDADAFSKAIMRYATKNSRWNSPKFLFGESYGTLRSAAVAWRLQQAGMALNGVVLLSSILNYGIEQPGYDVFYTTMLPSYAATAWYHHRAGQQAASLEAFLAEARAFAQGPYASALAKGHAISPEERRQIAERMGALTGLSPAFIERANLRVDLARFQKELLRDQRLTVGRLDSRYTGVDADAAGEGPDYDAADAAISGAFVSTLSDYLVRDLNYRTDMTYRPEIYGTKGFDWDWKHKGPDDDHAQNSPDVALDLSAAMRTNPYLKVLSLNGYYDMATPFGATEYDIGHMMLEPPQQANIAFRYYPSGHMVYLNADALHAMHADIAAFYDAAVASAVSGTPPHPAAIRSGATKGRSPTGG